MLSAVRQIRELDGVDTKTWFEGRWITIPQQINDFFNYMTYRIGELIKVLESKQHAVLASCCISVISNLIVHIKKKADKVVMFYDQ